MAHSTTLNSTMLKCKTVLLAATFALTACSSSDDDTTPDTAQGPQLGTLSEVVTARYSGTEDGLLGALGLSGIRTPPVFINDAAAPTVQELRRQAIHANYTALVDQSEAGGFGSLYGPIDDTTFAGEEHLAYVGEGINLATLMVQIPDSFDTSQPCIVAAPSSGSRGVYGAVATGGAWGLERGCAVAYTDANKGTGAVALSQNVGYGLQLQAIELATGTATPSFVVPTVENVGDTPDEQYSGVSLPTQEELDTYISESPNRLAFKHAHSQKNIEKDWGLHTIESVLFAFKMLNEKFEQDFNSVNTLVIGASVSNGGSAVLRAAEQAQPGLFDGIVAGEPNVNPQDAAEVFTIAMGERPVVTEHSKPAYEYFMLAELYAGCASKAPDNAGALFAELRGDTASRCNALVEAGLLAEGTLEQMGAESAQKLNEAGFLTESNKMLVGYSGIDLFQSLLATYASAYTRSSVVDALCNISMAHVTTGELTPSENPELATFAAVSNGIPRTSSVFLIKDDAPTGATVQIAATSSNGEADYNFEGALCFKDIYDNPDNPLNERLLAGIEQVKATANLQGTPSIIVHGRADALIPVNHSSRAYYALNKQVEGASSKLRYYEVKNAQHLDTLNPSYASVGMNFVPIDYYFKQSLDIMYEHLINGTALPDSQVVDALAPGATLQASDLTPISDAATGLISYENNVLQIPE